MYVLHQRSALGRPITLPETPLFAGKAKIDNAIQFGKACWRTADHTDMLIRQLVGKRWHSLGVERWAIPPEQQAKEEHNQNER